ncbi:hypothetical protein SEA_VROOMVROOM_51 [Arthrobacter phage VroomVroom]|uniref:Uncharacterized protein n=1 Tax=Arthrobacter phage VroomVroom TaxID=3049371 RepID=A0AA49IM63_9CAUD|nr:hypothetical protein SEA_VROOMVROOM_51 [Arthrobacter phage VroomVroom]
MFQSFQAAAVRTAYLDQDYSTARKLVAAFHEAGIVSYQEADKHNGGSAQVLVDGEPVGQASRLLVGPADHVYRDLR